MKVDQRLWRALHVLIHMSHKEAPMTSIEIGRMLNTNPVVVRRTLGSLRKKNLIQSEKGHGGGWKLICALEQISLYDVYEALGHPPIIAIRPASDTEGCLVEKVVNQSLDEVLQQARNLILERFEKINLAQIEKDFQVLYDAMPTETIGERY